MSSQNKEFECCPPFKPELWHDKMIEWTEKPFIKDKVFTMFYMPVNFGSVITRMTELVDKSGSSVPDWLCLCDHTSKWNMDLYLAVDKEIAGANNVTLSGKFYSRVYEGDFSKTGEWCKDMESHAKDKGLAVDKMYMWYTTCPKCAKKYGKNYVVIIIKTK